MEAKPKEIELLIPTDSKEKSDQLATSQSLCYYIKNLLALALPNTTNSFLYLIQTMTTFYLVGRLDSVILLDAYALSNTWTGILIFSIIVGLGSGMDTLISQSYGRKDYHQCGLLLYTSCFVLILAFIPCSICSVFSSNLFLMVGLDKQVSLHAQRCILCFLPVYLLSIPVMMIEKFMLGQKIAKPQMVFQIINTCVFPFHCYAFIYVFKLSVYGAIFARGFAYLLYLIELMAYLKYSDSCKQTLIAPTKEAITLWRPYMKIAFPSMLMIDLEWWAYSIMNLFPAKLGVDALAATTIGGTYANFLFIICLGMGLSIGSLVGNSIGEKNIANAKKYAALGVIMTVCIMLIIGTIAILFRNFLASFLTKDPDVVGIMKNIVFLWFCWNFLMEYKEQWGEY